MRSISDRRWPRRVVVCALLLLTAACERVVSVAAPASEPRLVVEARLERPRGRQALEQRIRLTTTQDVFSTESAPPARGASVRVVDDVAGTVSVFNESASEPGVYTVRNMALPLGRPFTLRITWDGDEYRASERMQIAVPLDSLYFEEGTVLPGQPVGMRATMITRDPREIRNFYLWDQWIDGVRQVSPDSGRFTRAVFSDELFDGKALRDFQPYRGSPVRSGQLVRLRQLAISEQAYRFFQTLSGQTANNGSPFGVPAGSVRGNVANTTTPSKLALGYFIVGEYSELEARVP